MSIFLLDLLKIEKSGLYQYLNYQTMSTDLILSVSLIYKGMRQTTISSGIASPPKYIHNGIDESFYEAQQKKLVKYMDLEKPYLLPELNLDDLAMKVGVSSKQLSQTINYCFKQNFNNFINRYRIEEAKRIMDSDISNRKTVYEILLDAGFNSKSVFNDSFKKMTGQTPKEYRTRN